MIDIRELAATLSSMYPGVQSKLLEPLKGNPLDILVATILSQNTNDNLSTRAYLNLKGRFLSWEALLESEGQEVEEAIAVCGLQYQKAKSIRSSLATVQRDFGELSLEPLRELSAVGAFKYLTSLTGVGPKTAACVQVFGLGQPAFPVDTHVLRVSKRLGLVDQRVSSVKAQATLERIVPDELKLKLHLLMIEHGRTLCHPSNPKCYGCPLGKHCLYEGVTEASSS